ncbi:hypothetical protein [Serinicoccus sediminis]|uniref:hypothetical protein n=1 Tax=Serinicoccus sediminis TaxID=2306021 RepID=UPI00101FAB32|nr:hypothetical protein [Serinicoccus sediminis]
MTDTEPTRVHRTREELEAAAAALTGFAHEAGCIDDAQLATTRARQFEQEALDAPPAHLVPDDLLLRVVALAVRSGVTALFAPSGIPEHVSVAAGKQASDRLLGDPMSRTVMLDSTRLLLAGKCVCGQPWEHDTDAHRAATDDEDGAR